MFRSTGKCERGDKCRFDHVLQAGIITNNNSIEKESGNDGIEKQPQLTES